MPDIIERKLTKWEEQEKERTKKSYVHRDTYTYSVKVGSCWYKLFQAKRKKT